jgi:hypothetical protein
MVHAVLPASFTGAAANLPLWARMVAAMIVGEFCAFHPNALVLRRREAASKSLPRACRGDAPARAGAGAAFWSILRDARLRLAPQSL